MFGTPPEPVLPPTGAAPACARPPASLPTVPACSPPVAPPASPMGEPVELAQAVAHDNTTRNRGEWCTVSLPRLRVWRVLEDCQAAFQVIPGPLLGIGSKTSPQGRALLFWSNVRARLQRRANGFRRNGCSRAMPIASARVTPPYAVPSIPPPGQQPHQQTQDP